MTTEHQPDVGAAPKLGPTGTRVAGNVARARQDADLSLRDLSERLRECGRPILASGILKIEQRQRRVDVDDLMALAIAADVTPIALLIEPVDRSLSVELTPAHTKLADDAWAWATKGRAEVAASRVRIGTLERYRAELEPVTAAVSAAVEAGIPEHVVMAAMKAVLLGRSMAQQFGPEVSDDAAGTDG